MAIRCPVRRAAARRFSITFRWPANSPWEKLSRATSIPARIICSMTGGESEAGPIVQTILVLWEGSFILMALLYLYLRLFSQPSRVERESKYSPPGGRVPPMVGQNRREQSGFRSACLASARHLSPSPSRKTECQLRPRQLNNFPTRTDKRTSASFCPAMGGMRPPGPARVSPALAANVLADGKSTEITYAIGRRPIFNTRPAVFTSDPSAVPWKQRRCSRELHP